MTKKTMSVWLALILMVSILTVILPSVSAMANDQNLSGVIWKSDGTAPTVPTEFAIWVEHSGVWTRYPSSGWVMTEKGTSDERYWYSYVLPNEDYGIKWADNDNYMVMVNGSRWGEFFGNTTSNGTGSLGDPFPTPYNPSNPDNMKNQINYTAGGGFFNEQQWDVRTVAPIDLVPINITVDGMKEALYPGGFPATPGGISHIFFNVTNVGIVASGGFEITLQNCSATGVNIGTPFALIPVSSLIGGGDTGILTANWPVSLAPGDYYVNLTVDRLNTVAEFDESNNRVILHFRVGPDLEISAVLVNGDSPMDPTNVPPDVFVTISVKVKNTGFSPTGLPGETFNVTLYNVTGPNGLRIPGTEIYQIQGTLNPMEESMYLNFDWIAPSTVLTDKWINITVDFFDVVLESNEDNNNITIHLFVPDTPVTTIWATLPKWVKGIIWYIDSTTELNFTVGGNYPPFYTWYRIINYTTGLVLKDWANYTLEGGGYFVLTWGEGTYRIEYYSIDSIPNTEPTRIKYIILDDTPPTSAIDFSAPRYRETSPDNWNITYQTQATITSIDNPLGMSIVGELNASGIGNMDNSIISYRIIRQSDSQVVRTWTPAFILINVNGVYTTQYFTFDAAWPDGLYTIECSAVDNLMHPESAKSTIVNYDNTAPAKTLDYGTPRYRAQTGHLWNITSDSPITLGADDGTGSGVNRTEYRVYGSTFDSGWVVYGTPFTISSSWDDGIYTIEYNSTDNLGNDATESGMFRLDNTGPTSDIDVVLGQQKFPGRYEVLLTSPFTFSADDGAGSGVQTIEYRRDSETTWHNYSGPGDFTDLFAIPPGELAGNHTIYVRSNDRLGNVGPVVSLNIFIEGEISPPLPPVLRVYLEPNKVDVRLEWEPSESVDIDHYLIYRSASRTEFDFTDVWVNTALEPAGNPVPLRTTWIDTQAAASDEYFYAIRGVDNRNNVGYTSNIAGKVTLTFGKGYNSFALPLAPFVDTTASQMLAGSQFADDTLYRYDTSSQQWIGRAKNMPGTMDDFTLRFGEGYMLHVAEASIDYTFCGSPGTAIRFMDDVIGDDPVFRDSLQVTPKPNGIDLSWNQVTDAMEYNIYRGTTRLDTDSLNDFSKAKVGTTANTQWTDSGATGAQFEYYYLVVAVDAFGLEGSSTYAVGAKKIAFAEGYSVISLQLQPKTALGLGKLANDMFTKTQDTLFYYDSAVAAWQGHPDILPENINNVQVNTGYAYIVYVDAEDVSFVFTGL